MDLNQKHSRCACGSVNYTRKEEEGINEKAPGATTIGQAATPAAMEAMEDQQTTQNSADQCCGDDE